MKYFGFLSIECVLAIKRFLIGCVFFFKYTTFRKCFNLFYVEFERRLSRKVIRGKPYFVKIQPTNICNADCEYCLKEKANDFSGKMSLSDYQAIIDSIKDYTCMVALHYSGEPLFNEHIYTMINYAHKNKIATYMSTNLQQCTPISAQRIVSSGLDLLTVSVDGLTQETYRRHRKKGSLPVVFDNIRILVEEKRKQKCKYPLINLQLVVTVHNEHEVSEFRSVAKSLGVDGFDFKPVGTYDKSILPHNPKYIRGVYRNSNIKRKPCWWLWGAMVISWDCAVIPCCMLPFCKESSNTRGKNIFSMRNSSLYQQLRNGTFCFGDKNVCEQCKIPYGNIFSQTM